MARRADERRPAWAAAMETRELDLADADGLARGIEGADAVVHLAAMNARACAADPAQAERINVGGTENVVRAARAAGAGHVLYMSTAHVYAAPLAGELDEEAPTANAHAYAATHRRAEDVVRAGGLTGTGFTGAGTSGSG
ncbi:MAG: NAD-dependent epimerase/dehydratase family protein, partial [Rhodospirillaceae bacterium]